MDMENELSFLQRELVEARAHIAALRAAAEAEAAARRADRTAQ